MKIQKVVLKNIRSFKGKQEFDFNRSSTINTVSGINGSGKTTLFKSIILAQRIFFFEQLETIDKSISRAIQNDITNYFTSNDSEISIYFDVDHEAAFIPHFTITLNRQRNNNINWKIFVDEESENEIKKFWNIEEPKRVIVYVDSNRFINEGDFTHEGVSLKSSSKDDGLALDYIFHPEKLFSSIYERIIGDYLRERVIPNKPRKDLPHVAAKIMFHKLMKYIQISNFTGLLKENQFVLQIRTGRDQRKFNKSYDLRGLSSGEKTIFYIIHFICYVNNIGMLIIDEPENNLHENLLTEFVTLLSDICKSENYGELIEEISKINDEKLNDKLIGQIKTYYKNHELTQVYLLTHSKNLIYNNFSNGINYIIDRDLKLLENDEAEQTLRSIGLSKIQSKVLFVEGRSDNQLLESLLAPHNIKVKALGNCHDVIDTYKKYLQIKENIKDVQFCFMVDKDTRSDEEINSLREIDQTAFDNSFHVLDRHEIENYFLDSEIYLELFRKHNTIFPEISIPAIAEITSAIESIATNHKDKVIKKTLQNLNQKSFGKLKNSVSNKSLPVNSLNEYESYIDSSFSTEKLVETVNVLKSNYNDALAYVSNWSNDWIDVCDGKIVFKEYLNTLTSVFKVRHDRLESEVINIAKGSDQYLVKSVIESIIDKFSDN